MKNISLINLSPSLFLIISLVGYFAMEPVSGFVTILVALLSVIVTGLASYISARKGRIRPIHYANLFLALGVPVLAYLYLRGSLHLAVWTIKCGHKPIIGVKGFYNAQNNLRPDDALYKYAFNPINPPKFFCTEAEAVESGYPARPNR